VSGCEEEEEEAFILCKINKADSFRLCMC